jgi:hypothetical protein
MSYGSISSRSDGVENWMVSSVGESEPYDVPTKLRLVNLWGGLPRIPFDRHIEFQVQDSCSLVTRGRRAYTDLPGNYEQDRKRQEEERMLDIGLSFVLSFAVPPGKKHVKGPSSIAGLSGRATPHGIPRA